MEKKIENKVLADTIYFEIASNCNLHCIHCSDLYESKSNTFLDFAKVEKFIKNSSSNIFKNFIITGGEPFLHKNLENFIHLFSNYGNAIITTNGSIIEIPKLIDFLIKYQNLYIQISFDSLNENVFDKIRGKGTFAKVKSLINTLISVGFSNRIGLSMTLMQWNSNEYIPLIKYAIANKIGWVHFPQLVPIGRARKAWLTIAPSINEIIKIEEELLPYLSIDKKNDVNISVNRLERILNQLANDKSDCLNNLTLKIDTSGEILPCPISSNHNYSLGNICDEFIFSNTITKINKLENIRNSNKLIACDSCNYIDACHSNFCENCILLNEVQSEIASYGCSIHKHHLKNAYNVQNHD